MSKAIRSYPRWEQAKVIARRRLSPVTGLGYLSAISLKADIIVNGQRVKETEQLAHALDSIRNARRMTNEEFGYSNLSNIPLDTQETVNAE